MWYIFNWFIIIKINIKFKWIINIRNKLNRKYKYINILWITYNKLRFVFIFKWNVIIWFIKKNWITLFKLLYYWFIKDIKCYCLIMLFIRMNWLIKVKCLIDKKYNKEIILKFIFIKFIVNDLIKIF